MGEISNPSSHYLYLYGASYNNITNNVFYGGSGLGGSGISITANDTHLISNSSDYNYFFNNTFYNVSTYAISIGAAKNNNFINNFYFY